MLTYHLSLLRTEGDVLSLSDEWTIDATEAWDMNAKYLDTGMVSSWKGQLSIVPHIQDPGPQST